MNGANRDTDPIERSISPATISMTSPAARIANGAKYGSSVMKLLCVQNVGTRIAKKSAARIATTMMLPSRSVRNRVPSSRAEGRRRPSAWAPALAGARVGAWPVGLVLLMCLRLVHAWLRRCALVARLRRVVGLDGVLVEELQPGVDFGDA